MLVHCIGILRSGSTLQYNIAKNLVERLGVGVGEGFFVASQVSDWRKFSTWGSDGLYHVIKMHNMYPRENEMTRSGVMKMCSIYRDVRDVAVSLKHNQGLQGDELFRTLDSVVSSYRNIKRIPNVFWQKYEDAISDVPNAIIELAIFLNLKPVKDDIEWIARECSIANTIKITEDLRNDIDVDLDGKSASETYNILKDFYDKNTLLLPNHISKNRGIPGAWRTELEKNEIDTIMKRHNKWLRETGYLNTASTHCRETGPFIVNIKEKETHMDQQNGFENLDGKLARFLTKEDGFFIEVGAGDGLGESSTLCLENRGWQGMLIEPVIEQCARCTINRPKAAVLNYDCVAHDQSEGLVNQDEFVQQSKSRRVKGNPSTLTSILDEFEVDKVDLLVLNVRGNGLNVIKGIDLLRYRPGYILVEESFNGEILSYLSRFYYELSEEFSMPPHRPNVLYRSVKNKLHVSETGNDALAEKSAPEAVQAAQEFSEVKERLEKQIARRRADEINRHGEDLFVKNPQAPLPEQETQPSAKMIQRPTSGLGRVAEMAVLADAMYRMGNRVIAGKYAELGFEAMKKDNNIGFVPRELLRTWQVPNLGAMFARMWLTFCTYSSYLARKKAKEVLCYWIEQDCNNAEPFIRFGLLMALDTFLHGQAVPRVALEALLYADRLLNDDRSYAALMLADRGVLNKLLVPYDGGQLHVYPIIHNMTTYILLEQGDWFEDDMKLFRALVRPGDSVLDLGANVGVYSISAARRAGEDGRVISVEPCKETFTLLSRSAAAFNNMKCIHAAVSETSDRGCLEPGNQPEFNKLQMGEGLGETVDMISVDELAEREGIGQFDLIKIDVEGHEIPVIRGAKKIIAENDPIILYEIKEGQHVHLELIDLFDELGYDSYFFCAPRGTLMRFHKGDQVDPFVLNMIAVRPESLSRFKGLVNIE